MPWLRASTRRLAICGSLVVTRAAFAHGDRLDRMEREDAEIAKRVGADAARAAAGADIGGTQRMAGIVDDLHAADAGDGRDLLELAAQLPVQMHVEDRIRLAGARDGVGERLAVISPVVGSTSAKTMSAPFRCGALAVARKVIAGTTIFLPGPQAQRPRRHMQRRRAVGADHRMPGAGIARERRLEARDRGARRQIVAAQHLGDRGDVVFLDDLAP